MADESSFQSNSTRDLRSTRFELAKRGWSDPSIYFYRKNGAKCNEAMHESKALGETSILQCMVSKRWILGYISFYGSLCMYLHRVNLNLAVICMVKSTLPDDGVTNVTSSNASANGLITSNVGSCGGSLEAQTLDYEKAEFYWSKPLVTSLLSSYFYGVLWTQILGGVLATKYGGKRVIGVSMAIQGVCCLFTPLLARASVYGLFAARVIIGLAAGVINPAFFCIWARWAPGYERGKLQLMNNLGSVLGTALSFSTSGLLCTYGFDNGWASIFYIHGGMTIGFLSLWYLFIADSPRQHSTISESEVKFIEETVGKSNIKVSVIPWKQMLTSRAVWVIIFTHICANWSFYVILSTLPMFMKEVLKFDIRQNGLFTSLPHVAMGIVVLASGHVSDKLRQNGFIGTLTSRRLFQSLAFFGISASLLGICFVECDQRSVAVVMLCVCTACVGLSCAGYTLNCMDIAEKYSGIVYGVSNTIANICGSVAPITVGLMTPNDSAEEWRYVFYVCIGISVAGALVFAILSEGNVQSWAKSAGLELTIEMTDTEITEEPTEKSCDPLRPK